MESVAVKETGEIQIKVRGPRFKAGSDLSSSVNAMAVDVTDNSTEEEQDITLVIRLSTRTSK